MSNYEERFNPGENKENKDDKPRRPRGRPVSTGAGARTKLNRSSKILATSIKAWFQTESKGQLPITMAPSEEDNP